MKTRSAIFALGVVLCCLISNSFGQTLVRKASRTKSLTKVRRISVATGRTIRVIPQAKNLKPDVGGTFIDLGFETSVSGNTLVSLSKVSGPLPPGTDSFKWTAAGTQHRVQFIDLEANTNYELQIDVFPKVSNGVAPRQVRLPFKTLQRHVFVALEEVFVYDDVDWDNAGDLDFGVQIGDKNGNFAEAGNSWDFLNFSASIDSGTGINLPQSGKPNYLYQNNVSSTTMKIAVTGNERDYAFGTGVEFRPNMVDHYLGTGEDIYNEYNSGYKHIDIGHTNLTPGVRLCFKKKPWSRTLRFTWAPKNGIELSYSLYGQLVVAYW